MSVFPWKSRWSVLVSVFICVYQGCSLGLERLGLEAVSRRFWNVSSRSCDLTSCGHPWCAIVRLARSLVWSRWKPITWLNSQWINTNGRLSNPRINEPLDYRYITDLSRTIAAQEDNAWTTAHARTRQEFRFRHSCEDWLPSINLLCHLLLIQLNTSFHLLHPSPDFISLCVIPAFFSSPAIPSICKILKLCPFWILS